MKFLAFSDFHVSIKHTMFGISFIEQAEKTFEWVKELVIKEKVDSILFLGDVFHVQQFIDSPAISTVARGFTSLLDCCPVYYVLGNHDVYQKGGTWYSVEGLRSSQGENELILIDKTESKVFQDKDGKEFQVLFIPYDAVTIPEQIDADFCAGHATIAGANFSPSFKEDMGFSSDFSKYAKLKKNEIFYIGGHYHHPQIVDNTVLIGSCCYHSYNDYITEIPRGCVIFDHTPNTRLTIDKFMWAENPHATPVHTIVAETKKDAEDKIAEVQKGCKISKDKWNLRIKLPPSEVDTYTAISEKTVVIPNEAVQTIHQRLDTRMLNRPEELLVEYININEPDRFRDKIEAKALEILNRVKGN